jgi:transposase
MARPTKLTPDTHKRIVQAIQLGATYELAAQYGGVAYNTFNEWMKAGEANKTGAFREFYDAVKEAEGKGAIGWLAKIEAAANDGSWQAAAWKLERRYPHEYGKTVVDQNTNGEMVIRVRYVDDPDS